LNGQVTEIDESNQFVEFSLTLEIEVVSPPDECVLGSRLEVSKFLCYPATQLAISPTAGLPRPVAKELAVAIEPGRYSSGNNNLLIA
jgi:hypothetical protein